MVNVVSRTVHKKMILFVENLLKYWPDFYQVSDFTVPVIQKWLKNTLTNKIFRLSWHMTLTDIVSANFSFTIKMEKPCSLSRTCFFFLFFFWRPGSPFVFTAIKYCSVRQNCFRSRSNSSPILKLMIQLYIYLYCMHSEIHLLMIQQKQQNLLC